MSSLRPLLVLALVSACTRGAADVAPPVDQAPPEPPPVLAEVAPAPEPEPEPEPPPPPAPALDLVATAVQAGGLTTFVAALETAGLRDTLAAPGPFTVFAPSDQAFAALPRGELDRLLKNKKKLAALLERHIIRDVALTAEALAAAPPPRTLAGAELSPPPAFSRPDLKASNGVLHVIDVVLAAPKPGKPAAQPGKPAAPAP